MSERDPFERLGKLVDGPVAPDARFTADLKSKLMSGLDASGPTRSRGEEQQSMDIPYRPELVAMPEQKPKRSVKPLILLEIAAVAALLIGIAAAIGSGMFSSDPEEPGTIPAAALQGDNATPTSLPPTVVPPDSTSERSEEHLVVTVEPTVAPPNGLLWQLPLPEGERFDSGAMAVSDGVIYRLLVTSGFAGVEAVDSASGRVLWEEKHSWSGSDFLVDDDLVYFQRGPSAEGVSTVVALDADSGQEAWSLDLDGFMMGMAVQNGILFVEDNRNSLKAIQDGDILWEQPIDPEYDESRPAETVYGINDPVASEETVVAMSETGMLGAFDIASGERTWSSDTGYPADTLTTVADDTLVLFHGQIPGTPVADSSEETSIGGQLSAEGPPWLATGLRLDDGTQMWERGVSGQVAQSATIDDTVAYVTIQGAFDRSGTPVTPHNSILYGLDGPTGEVIWSVSSDDSLFALPGAWFPAGGQQVQFVVATIEVDEDDYPESDTSLVFIDPTGQGRTEGVEIELEQVVISAPQGDQNGIYATMLDGTLIAIPPTAPIDDDD